MRCIILGCGGSNGVPEVNCDCYVCVSEENYNKRNRSSIYIETQAGTHILVDTSPDLRIQALKYNIKKVDAVFYTHAHYDHIGGIGDLKNLVYNNLHSQSLHDSNLGWYRSPYFQKKNISDVPAFMDKGTASRIINAFPFVFHHSSDGLYKALLTPLVFSGPFTFADLEVMPFWQKHGKTYSYGSRFGDLAYSTDTNGLTEEAFGILQGVKVWILDCIRYFQAPTHFSLEPMLNAVARVNPHRVIITHMGHGIEYYEFKNLLPIRIEPAYDGLTIVL